jgi:CubicO group peptidase (beta-lactamase class C family)
VKILLRFVSRLDILNIQRCRISYILFKLERIKRVRPFLSDYILLKLFGPGFRSHPFSLLLFKFISNPYLYTKSLCLICKHRSPGRCKLYRSTLSITQNEKAKLLIITVFFFILCFFCQSKLEKQLTKTIDELITTQLENISPGCAVLVAKNGKIVYQKAFGTADLELNVPMQPNMIFNIGSITKQFTAVCILQLAEQGKIALTDSLQKYIPAFPSNGHLITIENLLTQTSGITDYLNLDVSIPNPFRIDWTTKQIIDSLKTLPLEFSPNSKFAYSNSNYFLLGHIIEVASGKSYQEYLKQNILTQLGLSNTFYISQTDIIPNRVKGYEKRENKYYNPDFFSTTLNYSAGGIMSNVEDLYKWNEALHTYKLLKKETLANAFKQYKLSDGTSSEYGYGWYIRDLTGSKSIEHGGSIYGFRAEEIYLPQEEIYVVGLFNCRQLDIREKDLCENIVKTMLGKPLQKVIKLDDATLKSYIGTYQLANTPGRTIVITKENDHLLANLAGQGTWIVLFQTDTKFLIQGVEATCEFIKENDKTTKIVIQQNGEFVWRKIQ